MRSRRGQSGDSRRAERVHRSELGDRSDRRDSTRSSRRTERDSAASDRRDTAGSSRRSESTGRFNRRDQRSRDGARARGNRRRPTVQVPADLDHRIATDPLFDVVSLNGESWIEPYTGQAIPIKQDRIHTAKLFFTRSTSWRDREPLPIMQLVYLRWRHDLLSLLPREPRLRIFDKAGRGWLNPYTGNFHPEVRREKGKIRLPTIGAMAKVLTQAMPGAVGEMLTREALAGSVQRVKLEEAAVAQGDSVVINNPLLEADLERAQAVQTHMLAAMPQLDGYQFGVHYEAHSKVSGDFYEIMTMRDGRTLMVIGDVSGHGVQAALVVATALKSLRMLARDLEQLPDLLAALNDELNDDLLPGQFITVFAALLDPIRSHLQVLLAGHHPAMIANPDAPQMLRRVGKPGMALGLVAGKAFRASLHLDEVLLAEGDILLQCTDGLIEAINEDEVEFGIARIAGSLLSASDLQMDALVRQVAKDVTDFCNQDLEDDLTVLAFRREYSNESQLDSGELDYDFGRHSTMLDSDLTPSPSSIIATSSPNQAQILESGSIPNEIPAASIAHSVAKSEPSDDTPQPTPFITAGDDQPGPMSEDQWYESLHVPGMDPNDIKIADSTGEICIDIDIEEDEKG